MLAFLPFLCNFDVNDGHCMFIVNKPASERVLLFAASSYGHALFTLMDF
ncbi:unknown protein [Cronobacter turicensis z3032]|uniref:Uncharacterized protein n=1 Tax=Cronobacter turicensis (strain DSM 18703 / CCUG 55852 / LMG 23827 / z3032) TaxID=693216 RepID=C9Y1P2_CROTZ|nr:unknown protein [Cronobacter turicensis z3032]